MRRLLNFSVFALALIGFGAAPCFAQDAATGQQQLLEAATNGRGSEVEALLKAGVAASVKDASGRTPLYLAAQGGHQATAQTLLEHGADVNAADNAGRTPLDAALAGKHTGMAQFLRTKGAVRGAPIASPASAGGPSPTGRVPSSFHPDTQFVTAESFANAIGEPAVMLDSENVCLLAPKKREKAAAIVFPYLVRGYDELYKIVGVHTKYKMLVYAFPKGFPGVRGGTSGCVIKYTDENLVLENQPEWKQYRVPHVSGYIEEMAHNFVQATGARFTSEMVGWSISVRPSEIVAPNPVHRRSVAETRQGQEATYQRYLALGQTIPADLPWDQADRVHAYLLRNCELQYGPAFWSDFFKEVRKERQAFLNAQAEGEDNGRDARYRLTVQCFDRLHGVHFIQLLEQNGISTTADLSSLPHKDPGWNRKLK